MRRCFLLVYLPENRGPIIDHAVTPRQQAGWDQPHLTVEREFGTWQNADGEIGVLDVAEAAGTGTEVPGGELVAYGGRPRPDMVKTVIAHLGTLPFNLPGQPYRENEQKPLWFPGRTLIRLVHRAQLGGAGCALPSLC
jgi:hypothetical protein